MDYLTFGEQVKIVLGRKGMTMQVLDLMNMHENWEEILTQSPYNIKVSRDGDYILLKYNQLNSDFSIPIVRECRGAIFWRNEDGKYECVCYPFSKFGNYGESYVPDIDWNSAIVEEKVDGSLIKIWHHNGEWHVSTNGTIDAYKAEVDDMGLTFGNLFERAVKDKEFFFNHLDPNYTHMFELVSPESMVVVPYSQTKLYDIGCRNMRDMKEDRLQNEDIVCFCNVSHPKYYPLHTLDDCLSYVKSMTRDEEGFVVRDKHFNRMKIKSPEYLLAAHLRNNGAITTKRIIRMMQNNMIDDFVAYCPQYSYKVQEIIDRINCIANMLEQDWQEMQDVVKTGDIKKFVIVARECQSTDYLIAKYKDQQLKAFDWIMSRLTAKIMRMLKEYDV